jgi:hypothetical protein
MSPLWSDMALARVALAKAEEYGSADEEKRTPPAASRQVRRILHPRLSSRAL